MGYRNGKGAQVYTSAEMDGDMEPHVFSRFQRLSFDVEFYFDDEDVNRLLSSVRNDRFAVKDELGPAAIICQSNVIQNLVTVLPNASFIECLEIRLHFFSPQDMRFRKF